MQRFFFFSIEINGYWWLKLLDNSFSLVSMLCLLTVTDAESCLSASSHLWLCGLPVHLSLGEWVHEARSTPHSSSHPLVLLTIMNDVSISQSTVKMIAYLQRSKITLNLMMHDTYSPRTWVFFLWNNSCCSVRRCHMPQIWPNSSPRVHMQAQGGGCAFTLDGTSSSGFRGHSLLLPVGLTPLFPGGRGRMVTLRGPSSDGQVLGSLTRRLPENPKAHSPAWAWAGPREKYQGLVTRSLKWASEAPSSLSSQEALLCFANAYFSLEKKKEIKPVA